MIISLEKHLISVKYENKYSQENTMAWNKREQNSQSCHCFVLKEHYTSLKMFEFYGIKGALTL